MRNTKQIRLTKSAKWDRRFGYIAFTAITLAFGSLFPAMILINSADTYLEYFVGTFLFIMCLTSIFAEEMALIKDLL